MITRALGPEASVQVDIDIFPAKAGDLFLLCSDGLTSMVHEPQAAAAVRGERLARDARQAPDRRRQRGGRPRQHHGDPVPARGGRRTGRRRQRRRGRAARRGSDLRVRHLRGRGRARAAPGRDARRRGALPAAEVADAVEEEYRRDGTVALSAIRPGESEAPEEPPPKDDAARSATATPPPRRTAPLPGAAAKPGKRRRRLPVGLLVVLALLALVLAGGWMATRAVYFVGTDPRDDRTIAIFRGLPYDLPFGIELYERFAGSGVTIDDVPRARRSTFTDHKLRSRDDAENLVIALERGQIE